jgi:hypothetical protein
MSVMRRGWLVFVMVGALVEPAVAACPPLSARQGAETARLILTGVVETGPVSPARMRVEVWEKARGPATVEVDTGIYEDYALGEGIAPQPGERWRIYGERQGGRVLTGTCEGSHRIDVTPAAPRLAIAGASALLVRSTFAGRPLSGAAAPLSASPGRATRVRFSKPVLDVRIVGGPRKARLSRRGGAWLLRLPAGARGTSRLVADTGDAFFVARVRVTQPHPPAARRGGARGSAARPALS